MSKFKAGHYRAEQLKPGQRVFVEELGQYGEIVEVPQRGSFLNAGGRVTGTIPALRGLKVETPDGPRIIEWFENNYTLITGIGQVLYFIVQLLTGRRLLRA